MLYTYKFTLTRIIDGDTVVGDIDLGFGVFLNNVHVRLFGIDAPEVHTHDLTEKEKGIASTKFLESLLADKEIIFKSNNFTGKYGRAIGELFVVTELGDILNVNQTMIDEGYAGYYRGVPVDFTKSIVVE